MHHFGMFEVNRRTALYVILQKDRNEQKNKIDFLVTHIDTELFLC